MINDILNKYLNNEKTGKISSYSLDGITMLLEKLNNPHRKFKSLHIAGTNGKGSTAFMLSVILEKSGYKTALYTSPHLLKINERIKINSTDIDDALLFKYLSRIDIIVNNDKSLEPTYFDMLTAAAFCYFSDESVDVAVIETGLGGRLDSTNVIIPEVSILTDISIDHTGILGNEITKITMEKCGIIKPSVPVITSNTDPEIISIIEQFADKNNSELHTYGRDFFTSDVIRKESNFTFNYSGIDILYGISLPLFPLHQVKNTAVVIDTLVYLKSHGFPVISNEAIYDELKKVKVPGRFEILQNNPLIIYDSAHNYDSLNNLLKGLELYYSDKKILFILSMMKDKADDKTLGLLADKNVMYYILDDERVYIPVDNKFKLIISGENILVDILHHQDNISDMIIFTGTFRIYNLAVQISKIYSDTDWKSMDNL
jgi:dihydrofolate synthase/folylpolyglutamate synthase